eukprot:4382067-Pleurochrysis_carterae.AAC.2
MQALRKPQGEPVARGRAHRYPRNVSCQRQQQRRMPPRSERSRREQILRVRAALCPVRGVDLASQVPTGAKPTVCEADRSLMRESLVSLLRKSGAQPRCPERRYVGWPLPVLPRV